MLVTKHGIAYSPRGPRQRSLGSSQQMGKPSPGRSQAGDWTPKNEGGTRDARRRHRMRDHPRTWQTRTAAGGHLPTTLQPRPLPASLRPPLCQSGGHDSRQYQRNRGSDVVGKNRCHHHSLTCRTVSMDAGAPHLHPQKARQEAPPAGDAGLVGQAAARSHAAHSGGILRTAV